MQLEGEKAIYKQVAQAVEDGILSGAFKEGEAVPSTNQFARLYKINPATAAKGVNELVEEGVLHKRRGLGMFVSEGAKEVLRKRRLQEFYQRRLAELIREADQLGIDRSQLAQMILGEGTE